MTRRARKVTSAVRQGGGLAEAAEELALTLDDPETPPAAKAALARELRMLLGAIAAGKSTEQGSKIDELAARRKARRSG